MFFIGYKLEDNDEIDGGKWLTIRTMREHGANVAVKLHLDNEGYWTSDWNRWK